MKIDLVLEALNNALADRDIDIALKGFQIDELKKEIESLKAEIEELKLKKDW